MRGGGNAVFKVAYRDVLRLFEVDLQGLELDKQIKTAKNLKSVKSVKIHDNLTPPGKRSGRKRMQNAR